MRQTADGERSVIAAVLLLAVQDCAYGPGGEAVKAYHWIVDGSKDAMRYCELLDIDFGRFRANLIKLLGARCERFMRKSSGAKK